VREILAITRALADENRLRALACLRIGELCVCQIIELLGLAASTVSRHLWILRQAGLIEGRKEGRWMYYRLAGPDAPPAARAAIDWLMTVLPSEKRIAEDARRLKLILKVEPEVLCCNQREGISCCPAPEAAGGRITRRSRP
jgi:ArsR family transcriptional regulator